MRIETTKLIEIYKDKLFAIAFNICKNEADADDVVQDTFIQYHTCVKQFGDEQHVKAWLIRVAINKARNMSMSFWRRNGVPLEDYINTLSFETDESHSLFEEVLKLPQRYRIVIHLYYYEDYSIKEIAKLLRYSESNVKVLLMRGRQMLKRVMQEDWNDD